MDSLQWRRAAAHSKIPPAAVGIGALDALLSASRVIPVARAAELHYLLMGGRMPDSYVENAMIAGLDEEGPADPVARMLERPHARIRDWRTTALGVGIGNLLAESPPKTTL